MDMQRFDISRTLRKRLVILRHAQPHHAVTRSADKLTKTDLNQRAGDYNSLAKELWNFWSDVSEIVRRKKK